MCVYSMVSRHYFERFPVPQNFPPFLYPDYKELLRKAAEYDRMTGQQDCPDPEKEKWNKEVEDWFSLGPVFYKSVVDTTITSGV
jgi:hypothetical protein